MTANEGTHNSDYEEGMRDGRIKSLESMASVHSDRLDAHDKDFKDVAREFKEIRRMYYVMYGAILMAAFLPQLKTLLGWV